MRHFALTFVAVLLMLAPAAQAADPELLDVENIRLGMSLDDARTELVARGYEIRIGFEPAPFGDIVQKALGEISGPVPRGGLMQFKTTTQIIILKFVVLPDEPEVSSITYRLNDPSISYAKFSETAIGRYGEPDFNRASLGLTPDNLPRLYWRVSSSDKTLDASSGVNLELAYSKKFGESEYHSGQITLQDVGERQKQQAKEIDDAIRATS